MFVFRCTSTWACLDVHLRGHVYVCFFSGWGRARIVRIYVKIRITVFLWTNNWANKQKPETLVFIMLNDRVAIQRPFQNERGLFRIFRKSRLFGER